jgi:hypothetical protein
MSASPSVQEFPFRLDRSMRPILLLFGVTGHSRAWVRLESDRLVVRYGWWTTTIPLADIDWWDITGPYHWIRAVGARHTLLSTDMAFDGSARDGFRVHMTSKRGIAWVKADQLYVTVEDPMGLGAALTARGISGSDKRKG